MAKNLSSVEFTNELENSKRIIGELKNDALSYMASYQTMKFHERARQHQKIVRNFGLVQQFVLRTKIGLINNTGQKFEFENLRRH